jgi:hypothetical protein
MIELRSTRGVTGATQYRAGLRGPLVMKQWIPSGLMSAPILMK